MKILLLFFPFLAFAQSYEKKVDVITVTIKFEVVDSLKLYNDKIYFCKDGKRIRVSKDSIYIMGKHQYLKLKR